MPRNCRRPTDEKRNHGRLYPDGCLFWQIDVLPEPSSCPARLAANKQSSASELSEARECEPSAKRDAKASFPHAFSLSSATKLKLVAAFPCNTIRQRKSTLLRCHSRLAASRAFPPCHARLATSNDFLQKPLPCAPRGQEICRAKASFPRRTNVRPQRSVTRKRPFLTPFLFHLQQN